MYSEPDGYHIHHPTSTLNVVAPAGVWQWPPARALQGGPSPDTPAPSSFALRTVGGGGFSCMIWRFSIIMMVTCALSLIAPGGRLGVAWRSCGLRVIR